MAANSAVKLASVESYWNNEQSAQMVAAHYKEEVGAAREQIAYSRQMAMNAGF